MTPAEIKAAISTPLLEPDTAFRILKAVGLMLAKTPDSTMAQEILIRLLARRDECVGQEALLNALLRHVGLFPYAEPDHLGTRDLVALEFHRPAGPLGDAGVVFHRVQAEVYWALMGGENVILSAPTSFGKSLLIDAMVASGRFRQIALVVPTIALIDETRKRLARFAGSYKIITHGSQRAEEGRGTIFILTQERVIERDDLDGIKFFIIDEFYKLNPQGDDNRADILNHALYKLLATEAQFYLLGPNIRSVPLDPRGRINARVIVSDYATVASDVVRVNTRGGKKEALLGLAKQIDGPALIYCQSPASVRRVTELLLSGEITDEAGDLKPTTEWLEQNFHAEWIVTRALARQIGVHHGRIPRAIAQHQVRLFNEGKLKFLVCTSTLIEGVNTAAKHVIIYDNKIARANLDYFTFRNIQGRSGRMFRHFVGTVHLFYPPPEPDLLEVDIPIITQGDNASDSLLVQIETSDLEDAASVRVNRIRSQPDLSFSTIKANSHIDPGIQIEIARTIRRDADRMYPQLNWRTEPDWDQLLFLCELLFDTLLHDVSRDAVRSHRQLAFLIQRLKQLRSPSHFIQDQIYNSSRGTPDERIEGALEFLRNWASFHFPRALIALERIQHEVFTQLGYSPGAYASFAARIENLMLSPTLVALDEYGVPLPLAEKIRSRVREDDGLDALLADLKALDLARLQLSGFEQGLLSDVRQAI